MLVKIRFKDGGFLYRNVLRKNLKKMARSIHIQFPYTNYASLEGVIFNALQKEQSVLVLDPPIAQVAEQAPYKG